MELIFWWILPAAAVLVPAAWIIGRRRHRARDARRRPVAHSDRLTALPEYQAALRKHRNRLRLLAAAGTVLMVAAVVAAARPAERSTVRPEQHQRDIILCLDASGSMNSADAAVVDVFGCLATAVRRRTHRPHHLRQQRRAGVPPDRRLRLCAGPAPAGEERLRRGRQRQLPRRNLERRGLLADRRRPGVLPPELSGGATQEADAPDAGPVRSSWPRTTSCPAHPSSPSRKPETWRRNGTSGSTP